MPALGPEARNNNWEACISRYEKLKQHDHWYELSVAMLELIKRIQRDSAFPDTTHTVSHGWLRIGPITNDPAYRPGVWVGWRSPDYYWIGIGSFGTQKRLTVSGDKAVSMLKRYLTHLKDLDPSFRVYVNQHEDAQWSPDALTGQFNALTFEDIAPAVRDGVSEQLHDARLKLEQLYEMLNELPDETLRNLLDGISRHIDRADALVSIGLERYMTIDHDQQGPVGLPMPTMSDDTDPTETDEVAAPDFESIPVSQNGNSAHTD